MKRSSSSSSGQPNGVAGGSSAKQAKKTPPSIPECLLTSGVQISESGDLTLRTGRTPDSLRSTLRATIAADPSLSRSISDWVRSALQNLDAEYFGSSPSYKLFLPLVPSAAVSAPSLLRVLLGARETQAEVLKIVAEQLAVLVVGVGEDEGSGARGLLQMLVSHLQWLEIFAEDGGKSFVGELMRSVVAMEARSQMKTDLILAIPTIVPPAAFREVLPAMQELMGSESPAVILETVSRLSLSDEDAKEWNRRALKALDSVQQCDMNALLSFVLANTVEACGEVKKKFGGAIIAEDSFAFEVVRALREKISLEKLFLEQGQMSRKGKDRAGDNGQLDRKEFVEKITLGLRLNKAIREAILQELSKAEELTSLDLLLLLCLHAETCDDHVLGQWQTGTSAKTAPVFKLLDKGGARKIRPTLVRQLFCVFLGGSCVAPIWKNSRRLAESLVANCSSPASRELGRQIYSACLQAYQGSETAPPITDVLSSLELHLTSKCADESRVAVDVLLEIAREFPVVLVPHITRLRGILDHIENLAFPDVVRVYDVFVAMWWVAPVGSSASDAETTLVQNDQVAGGMTMLIKKLLSFPGGPGTNTVAYKCRRNGLAGTVALLSRLAPHRGNNQDFCRAFDDAQECLNRSSPSLLPLLYDSLVHKVQNINDDSAVYLTQSLQHGFEQLLSSGSKSGGVAMELDLNTKVATAEALCSMFRLLGTCAPYDQKVLVYAQLKPKLSDEHSALEVLHRSWWYKEVLNVLVNVLVSENSLPSGNTPVLKGTIESRFDELCTMEFEMSTISSTSKDSATVLPHSVLARLSSPLSFMSQAISPSKGRKVATSTLPEFRSLSRGAILYLLREYRESDETVSAASLRNEYYLVIVVRALQLEGQQPDGDTLEVLRDGVLIPACAKLHRAATNPDEDLSSETRDRLNAIAVACLAIFSEVTAPIEGCEKLLALEDKLTTLELSTQWVHLVTVLKSKGVANDAVQNCNVSESAGTILFRNSNVPSSPLVETCGQYLLRICVESSANPVAQIASLVDEHGTLFFVDNVPPKDGKSPAKCGKSHYRVLWSLLNATTKANKSTATELECLKSFERLVSLSKHEDGSLYDYRCIALSMGQAFLAIFSKKSVAVLNSQWDSHREQIADALQNRLQPAADCLHALCQYGKRHKNLVLTKSIPGCLKAQEAAMYAVKGLLDDHKMLNENSFKVETYEAPEKKADEKADQSAKDSEAGDSEGDGHKHHKRRHHHHKSHSHDGKKSNESDDDGDASDKDKEKESQIF